MWVRTEAGKLHNCNRFATMAVMTAPQASTWPDGRGGRVVRHGAPSLGWCVIAFDGRSDRYWLTDGHPRAEADRALAAITDAMEAGARVFDVAGLELADIGPAPAPPEP